VDEDDVKRFVRDIPDWPEPGVTFRDITPLLNDSGTFRRTIDSMTRHFAQSSREAGRTIDRVLGVEARGFVFAAPVAYALAAGFVPVRKPGKLPWKIEQEEYALEYGTDLLEIHTDAIQPGETVVIIDDVLATGGTAAATIRLVERLGGDVHGLAFVVEIGFLGGRARLEGHDVLSLATYR
jgi:adenine phosphoribosyltransferase